MGGRGDGRTDGRTDDFVTTKISPWQHNMDLSIIHTAYETIRILLSCFESGHSASQRAIRKKISRKHIKRKTLTES